MSQKIKGRKVRIRNPAAVNIKLIFLFQFNFKKDGKIKSAIGKIADNHVDAIITHRIAVRIKFLSIEIFFV